MKNTDYDNLQEGWYYISFPDRAKRYHTYTDVSFLTKLRYYLGLYRKGYIYKRSDHWDVFHKDKKRG